MHAAITKRRLVMALLTGAIAGFQQEGRSARADPFASPPAAPVPTGADSAQVWTFDAMPAGHPPAGFTFGRTGGGTVGRWVVRAAPDAPSRPNLVVQTDTNATSNRFPVAVPDLPLLVDVTVSVRCKQISGRVDQACGLVFRYQDENNYYVTRANALEDNVRLYYVRDGRRTQIAHWGGRVTPGEWHELRADARGDLLAVYWDAQRVIQQRDATFSQAGRIGLWLKADSFTEFDDLRVAPSVSGNR